MAEDTATQGESTEEQTQQEAQTVSAEQFAELQKQLEETRKAQSGSDRRVQELTQMLEQREQKAEEEKKSLEEKNAERMAQLEEKFQNSEREKQMAFQRSIAMEMLGEVGLKSPQYLDRLIGDDEAQTRELIQSYIDDKQAAKFEGKEEVAKKHGRTVTKTDPSGYGGMSYQEMQKLPDSEFNKIPSEVVEKAMESELK